MKKLTYLFLIIGIMNSCKQVSCYELVSTRNLNPTNTNFVEKTDSLIVKYCK
jgi:hypothetical protein